MSKPILQKTSFGLLRTNPKLTTNVKLVVDTTDVLYLESFSATQELSKSKYKGFKVSSNSNYYFDLYRFYNNDVRTSMADAFSLYQRDDHLSIQDKFGHQYDTYYAAGAKANPSKLYEEEYSLFAPLWLEPSTIPDYFIIFKTKDPVSVNTSNATSEADSTLIDKTSNPVYFTENILNNSEIVQTFDLTESSNIGRYLRNHASNEQFPEASILSNFEKGRYFRYSGMDLRYPGFATKTKELYYDTWPTDKTIIEYEDRITNGFESCSIAHPNIINLEFLFNDEDSDNYSFNRYFGLYVDKNEYNKFYIDGDALFEDRFNQPNQLPVPLQNNIGYSDNTKDQIQESIDGITLYAQTPPISSIDGTNFFKSEIVKDLPRIGYVFDTDENFYKIQNNKNFGYGTLKLNDNIVNWKTFSGFTEPNNYVRSEFNDVLGRSQCIIEFVNKPEDNDQFRILFTDTNDPSQFEFMDQFTITANVVLNEGTFNSNSYSPNGPLNIVAKAFADCVNNLHKTFESQTPFSAISVGNKVILYTRSTSESWNRIEVNSYSSALTYDLIAIKFISDPTIDYESTIYNSSPQPFTLLSGWVANGTFVGGNNNTFGKIKIDSSTNSLLNIGDYLITSKGYSKIDSVVPYLDEPILNELDQIIGFKDMNSYYIVNIEDTDQDIVLTSDNQCSIVTLKQNECGLLSIYPVKDFDFDFYNTDYMKDADSNLKELYQWYSGVTGPNGQTSSLPNANSGATFDGIYWMNRMIGPKSEFVEGGEFQGLMGISNELLDTDSTIYNEYDRLKENDVKQLAIASRVVPYINKWVYDDDGLDVRQNPYRLNADAAFRYPNFGPSFREFSASPKFYTHEWCYLQQYPPYMPFEEKLNSFSYFNNPIELGATFANTTSDLGLSTVSGSTTINDLDYFTEYFTRETIGSTSVSSSVKYNTFGYATDERFAETLFRGAKVIVKERVDFTDLNFNISDVKFRKTTKYNGYKFASIIRLVENGISLKVIENEKFKTITLLVEVGLMDDVWTKLGSAPIGSTSQNDYFIDRTLLYTLRDKITPTTAGATAYKASDVNLSGAIEHWELNGSGVDIYGTYNYANGTNPNFISEIQPNEDGSFNSISVPNPVDPTKVWVIENIKKISTNRITAGSIKQYNIPFSPGDTSTPNDNYLYNAAFLGWNVTLPSVFSENSLWSQVPVYLEGGLNAYTGIIEEASFANIAEKFNSGAPDIEYITYKNDGSVLYNDKVLELSLPIETYKANYLLQKEDLDIPDSLDSETDLIGYVMSATRRSVINVMSRYNGRYQPKFNDIFYFKDYAGVDSAGITGPRTYGFDKYRNLELNIEDPKFGLIENYFYNKVNTENPKGILKLNSISGYPSLYPLIQEIAIDKRNLYTFLSNWDIAYYQKNLNRRTKKPVMGYRGAIENKSFFGSKMLTIPDEIRLENFSIISSDDLVGGAGNIMNVTENVIQSNTEQSAVNAEIKIRKNTRRRDKIKQKNKFIGLSVFSDKALIDYLRSDGIDKEFIEYINPDFSFGEGGLDDDIEQYIINNVVPRYKIKRIIFYENQFANNVNSLKPIELDLSNLELLKKGYKISENAQIKISTDSPLNFKLIYTIPKLDNYSISFKVDLEKK
jgi:hypothetical protein